MRPSKCFQFRMGFLPILIFSFICSVNSKHSMAKVGLFAAEEFSLERKEHLPGRYPENEDGKIVGGEVVDPPTRYPWMSLMFYKRNNGSLGTWLCGGSLIARYEHFPYVLSLNFSNYFMIISTAILF